MKRSSLWLLPLLLAGLVAGAWYFDRQAEKADRELPVYVTGGERMAAGEEIYRRGTDDKPFTYPPFAAVPFVPFAKLPRNWQPEAWFAINYAILLAMLWWLHRWARADETGRAPPRLLWFWLFTGIFGGRHVVSVFTNQSHDLLIAGLVTMTASAWCRYRASAGMWAGLAAATKATPLLFVGLFGLRWHWLALVAIVGAAGLATAAPDWIFPRAVADAGPERFGAGTWWRAWYDVNLSGLEVGGTARAIGAWNPHSVLNQSLSGAVVRLFTPVEIPNGSFVVGDRGDVLLVGLSGGAVRALTIALQLAVVAAIAWGVRGAARAVATARILGRAGATQRLLGVGEVAAVACGMVLLSPQSSKAHFCIWLFPVAFVVNFVLRTRRDALVVVLGALAFVLAMLSKELLGRQLGNIALAWGNVTWATVLLLAATVRCLRIAGRTHDGEEVTRVAPQ